MAVKSYNFVPVLPNYG